MLLRIMLFCTLTFYGCQDRITNKQQKIQEETKNNIDINTNTGNSRIVVPINEEIEYSRNVKEFLTEASYTLKLLTTMPSLESYNKSADKVQDLYSKLPDPPNTYEKDRWIQCHANLKVICLSINYARRRVELAWDYVKLHEYTKSDEIFSKELNKQAREGKEIIKEIEKLVEQK